MRLGQNLLVLIKKKACMRAHSLPTFLGGGGGGILLFTTALFSSTSKYEFRQRSRGSSYCDQSPLPQANGNTLSAVFVACFTVPAPGTYNCMARLTIVWKPGLTRSLCPRNLLAKVSIIKRVRNLSQNAGNGHFRGSNFQTFLGGMPPEPP